ncbi:O-antigen ligase family protein [Sphingomonas edaphi]|uniref:O-antigen ligase family protein n=1 Tax=Sphingomonas edaphi TaxID=2315689 RepID=A0A418PY88_9SPHN|nr:O-antigen ligase family protein [Sphingomonas edaphi]RIX27003.1 O-antigen ligase family protein [Sphingomonas edaphi]
MLATLPAGALRQAPFANGLFAAALVAVFLIGGGGAEGFAKNGLLAAAGSLLLFSVLADQFGRAASIPRYSWPIAIAGLLLLAVPVIQLIPLPAEMWKQLAGRENAVQALSQVGAANSWRPLTLDAEATIRSATVMLLPVALLLHTLRSSGAHRHRLLQLIAVSAAISGLIAAAQLALGSPSWLTFYGKPSVGAASGLFANPNHQALFMAIAMVVCAMLIRTMPAVRSRRKSQVSGIKLACWFGILFFAVMCLAAGARAGVLLLGLAIPGSLLIAMGSGSTLRWTAALGGVLALLWLIVLLYPGTNSLGLRESFRVGEDARYAYLPDILYTLEQYWKSGSGLGTFVQVFSPNENLDLAQRGFLNHAHNDLLEWLTETGVIGAAYLAIAAAALAYAVYRAVKVNHRDLGIIMGAVLIILLAVLHSLADYPLRTLALASLFAFAVGLLGNPPKEREETSKRSKMITAIAVVLALPIAVQAVRVSMAEAAIREGQPSAAAAFMPANAFVKVDQSGQAFRAKDWKRAEQLAADAIIARPMTASALRSLALAREAQGKPAGQTWQLASALGWRDPPTQFWAFQQALSENEYQTAVLRAGALLRTTEPPASFIRIFRIATMDPQFAEAVANRMRIEPPWRAKFFQLSADPNPDEIRGLITTLKAQAAIDAAPRRSDIRSLVSYLIGKKRYADAMQVRSLLGPNDPAVLLEDGGFDRPKEDYAKDSTLFDWQVRSGSSATGSVEPAPPSHLVADSKGDRIDIAAERYLQLPPAAYRLTYRARADAPESFRVRLLCAPANELAAQIIPQNNRYEPAVVDFTVPQGCLLTRLVIEGLATGRPAAAELDEFELSAR